MGYFGAEILADLKTILDNNLSNMITTLRTEKSDVTIPLPSHVTWARGKNQYPEIEIDLDDGEIDFEAGELTNNINSESLFYNANIFCSLKDMNNERLILHTEYYLEALKRILHGYGDSNITWIYFLSDARENIQTNTNKYLIKQAGIRIQIRIN